MSVKKIIGAKAPPPAPKPVAQDAVPRPLNVPGFGTMPFKPGALILLPEEEKELRALGWKEGDPIPPNLGQILKKEKDSAKALAEIHAVQQDVYDDIATALPVDANTPPVRMPKEVPIETLPPERQQALKEFMSGYKNLMQSQANNPDATLPSFVPMASDPSINQAMMAARQQQNVRQDAVRVVDTGATRAGGVVVEGTKHQAIPSPAPAQPQPQATPVPGVSIAGGLPPLKHCPQCNHKLADAIDLVPDAADKMVFTQSLASDDQRFKKAFDLFGGKVKVVFKDLTVEESELCVSQVAYDQRDGKIVNYDQAALALMDYRLALSLDYYKIGDVSDTLPTGLENWEVAEVQAGQGPRQTKLPLIVEYLQKQTPLGKEQIWRALGQMSQKFHKLSAYLESRAPDPDFWRAIDGQA